MPENRGMAPHLKSMKMVMILQSPSEPIKSMNIHSLGPAKSSHQHPFFHPKSMNIDPKSIKTPSKTYHTSIKPCKIHQNSIKNLSKIHQTLQNPSKFHQTSIKPYKIFQIFPGFLDFFRTEISFFRQDTETSERRPTSSAARRLRRKRASERQRQAEVPIFSLFFSGVFQWLYLLANRWLIFHIFQCHIFFWGFSNGCSDMAMVNTIYWHLWKTRLAVNGSNGHILWFHMAMDQYLLIPF